MAVDLSSLPQNVNQLANIILVNPQRNVGITAQDIVNYNKAGLSLLNAILPTPSESFLFHVPGEDTVTLTSDVTDHYTESNTALQDQIALKPEIVVASGFIGELNNVPPRALEPLKTAADKLTQLDAFVPGLSRGAIVAYNQAMQAYAAAATALNAVTTTFDSIAGTAGFDPNPPQNKQQQAFTRFYGYWKQRQLFTVQTPWAIFTDMVIQTLKATQEENTRMITNFEITFKKLRFAQTIVSLPLQAGRAGFQGAVEVDKGVSKPVESVGASSALSTNFGAVA